MVDARTGEGSIMKQLTTTTGTAKSTALLMAPEELAHRLERGGSSGIVIIEVVSPEEARASPARIPTSQRVWRPEFQEPVTPSQPLDGLAPTAEAFSQFAQQLGISEETEVVILSHKYDETRLWWLFIAFGKRSVWVLDGGYEAWMAAGLPSTTSEQPACEEQGTWLATPLDGSLLATRSDVLALRIASPGRLWDVRTREEFRGTVTLNGAAQPGRIPWASGRLEWSCFRRADGRWRDSDEIRKLAVGLIGATPGDGGGPHCFYCQSGVRTTQVIFGLALAGWPLADLRNYDGSWVEWSRVATADEVLCGSDTLSGPHSL